MFQDFLKPLYKDLQKIVTDTLFPVSCFSCEKEGSFLCTKCQDKLEPVEFQICIICKKPSLGGITHPKCFSPHSPDQLISVYNYHNKLVEDLVIKGKYYFIKDIFTLLGKLMAQKIKTDFPNLLNTQHLALSPVPLNKWRLRWRGFNQSELTSEAIAQELNLPIINALIRNKITRTQKDLKKEDRLKNMESAFTLSPLSLEGEGLRVRGKSFILIDDVTTTGSTLLEASKVLKRNGAEKVICLTVARD